MGEWPRKNKKPELNCAANHMAETNHGKSDDAECDEWDQ